MQDMHKVLDIRSLLLVISLISLVIGVSYIFIYRVCKTYPGFLIWTLAFCASAAGSGLMAMRGFIPGWLSIITGTFIFSFLPTGIVHGLQSFSDRRPSNKILGAVIVLITIMMSYFTFLRPDTNARIVVISLALGLLSLWSAQLISKSALMSDKKNLFLITGFTIYSVLNMGRAAAAGFFESDIADLMQASDLQGGIIILMAAVHLALASGLIILNFQRTEKELQDSIAEIKILRGIIPICSSCKKVRDDQGYWNQIEAYLSRHSEARFSHGICPECIEKFYAGEPADK